MSSEDHRKSSQILALEAKKAQRALGKRRAMCTAGTPQGPSTGKDEFSKKQTRKKVKVKSVQDLVFNFVEQQAHQNTDALNDVVQQGNADQAAAKSHVTEVPEVSKLGLLLSILQKRDSHKIFAHPVDPNKVAGYYNVIKDPMDFSTIAMKLSKGKYKALEEFEGDVYLVFSNAMLFNSSNTIFYRQACAIKEVARKLFYALRSKPESFEAEFSILKLGTGKWTNAETRLINSILCDKNLHGNHSNGIVSGGLCIGKPETGIKQRRDTYKPLAGHGGSLIPTIYQGPKPLISMNLQYSYGDSLRSFCHGLGKSAQAFAMQKLQNIWSNPKLQESGYQVSSALSMESKANPSLFIKPQRSIPNSALQSDNLNEQKIFSFNHVNLGKDGLDFMGHQTRQILHSLGNGVGAPLFWMRKAKDFPHSFCKPNTSDACTEKNPNCFANSNYDMGGGFFSNMMWDGIKKDIHGMSSSYQGLVEHTEPMENDAVVHSCIQTPQAVNNSGVGHDFKPLDGLNATNLCIGGQSLSATNLVMNSGYQDTHEDVGRTFKFKPYIDLNQEQPSPTFELTDA